MQTTVRLQTRVKPGKRIEIESPSLEEGELVDVAISSHSAEHTRPDALTPEERLTRFDAWINKPRNYPPLPEAAFHRASYYDEDE